MKIKRSLLILAFFASPTLPAQSQGTLYLSNLAQSPAGSAPIGSDNWLAESFQTGAYSPGYFLDSIELSMGAASGNASNFSVSLYGGGGFPGHLLSTLNGSMDPSQIGLYTYSASGFELLPNTIYFVVLTSGTPAAQGAFMQEYATGYNYGSMDNWALTQYRYTSSDGANWGRGGYPGDGLQFAITASPVPEPSTYALGTVGALALGFNRWRKFSR